MRTSESSALKLVPLLAICRRNDASDRPNRAATSSAFQGVSSDVLMSARAIHHGLLAGRRQVDADLSEPKKNLLHIMRAQLLWHERVSTGNQGTLKCTDNATVVGRRQMAIRFGLHNEVTGDHDCSRTIAPLRAKPVANLQRNAVRKQQDRPGLRSIAARLACNLLLAATHKNSNWRGCNEVSEYSFRALVDTCRDCCVHRIIPQ